MRPCKTGEYDTLAHIGISHEQDFHSLWPVDLFPSFVARDSWMVGSDSQSVACDLLFMEEMSAPLFQP